MSQDITASGRTKICNTSRGAGFLSVFGTVAGSIGFEFSKDGVEFAPLTVDEDGTAFVITEATTREITAIGKGELYANSSGAQTGVTAHFEQLR